MALLYLIDENLLDRRLWRVIEKHNELQPSAAIHAIRVGDVGAPPQSTADKDLVDWATARQRVIVSRDVSTLVSHYIDSLTVNPDRPPLLIIRNHARVHEVVEWLSLASEVLATSDYRGQVLWIP